MDNKHDILTLLRDVAGGAISPEDALLQFKEAPFEDLDYAKIDYHRSVRQGAAEVIYGAGKTPEQIVGIVTAMGNPVRGRGSRHGGRAGVCDRRPCGLPGGCSAYECRIRRKFRRPFRTAFHAQFLCFRVQRGQH